MCPPPRPFYLYYTTCTMAATFTAYAENYIVYSSVFSQSLQGKTSSIAGNRMYSKNHPGNEFNSACYLKVKMLKAFRNHVKFSDLIAYWVLAHQEPTYFLLSYFFFAIFWTLRNFQSKCQLAHQNQLFSSSCFFFFFCSFCVKILYLSSKDMLAWPVSVLNTLVFSESVHKVEPIFWKKQDMWSLKTGGLWWTSSATITCILKCMG